jgi:hypothetical protein
MKTEPMNAEARIRQEVRRRVERALRGDAESIKAHGGYDEHSDSRDYREESSYSAYSETHDYED